MVNRWWWTLGLSCALLVQTEHAQASFLVSMKAMGMGATGVAYTQDTLCAAYNPAGMVRLGTRTDIGFHWIESDPSVQVTDSTLTGANGTFPGSRGKNFGTPEFGTNWMVFDSIDVSVGLIAYTREHYRASYPGIFPAFGTTSPLMMEFWQGSLSPVVSMKFDKFYIGASADFICQTFKAEGLQNFDVTGSTVAEGDVTNRKVNAIEGFTYTIGVMYDITPCLTLGGSYQFRMEGHKFHNYRGLLAKNGRVDIPERILGGFNYHPCGRPYTISVDVEHVDWGKIPAIHHTFPDTLTDLQTTPFGGPKGPGFGWEDIFLGHVGMDWEVSEGFTLRVGYRYSQELVRKQETFMNTLTNQVVNQLVTAGYTVYVSDCTEVSGYAGYGWRRTVHGAPIGDDFGGGTYDLTNQTYQAGLSMGWYW